MQRLKSLANVAGLLVALLLLFIFFSWKVKTFPTLENLQNITRQSVITVFVALGLTYVIVSAGIDLSVGSVAAFSCVVVATVIKAGQGPVVAIIAGLLAGAFAGLVNGGLITGIRVVPFIVTLGTYSLFRGAAKGVAHSENVYPPSSWLDNILKLPDKAHGWMLFPFGVWLAIILAVLMGLMLRYTRFGRHVIAVGSNENAARLCGVPIARVKLAVYVLSGLFAGIAGLMFYGRENVGDPTAAVGLELDGIAAVVIGGASLNGGQGSILGSCIGALLMATWQSGAGQMGLEEWIQQLVTGIVIVFAVALDRIRRQG